MGDRYNLDLRCDWCGEVNEDVCYAESCDMTDFKCWKCKKKNIIVMGFNTVRPKRKHSIQ